MQCNAREMTEIVPKKFRTPLQLYKPSLSAQACPDGLSHVNQHSTQTHGHAVRAVSQITMSVNLVLRNPETPIRVNPARPPAMIASTMNARQAMMYPEQCVSRVLVQVQPTQFHHSPTRCSGMPMAGMKWAQPLPEAEAIPKAQVSESKMKLAMVGIRESRITVAIFFGWGDGGCGGLPFGYF